MDQPPRTQVEHRREPRHIVRVAGRYRQRMGNTRDIWIKDISEYGCQFFDKFSMLPVGGTVSVRVGNIGPIAAEVKWRNGSTVGAEFELPLHPGVLAHIIDVMEAQSAKEPPAS